VSDPAAHIDARAAELRERLDALEAQLIAIREARSDSTADDEHDPEGSTLAVEWSRVEGQRSEVARELQSLDAAIGRVDAGGYGICVSCGNPIPAARLELLPGATRCVPCASGR
jgi:DnaK suppressor protein